MGEKDFDFNCHTLLFIQITAFSQLENDAPSSLSFFRRDHPKTHLFHVQSRADFQAFVAVLLRVIFRDRFLKNARRRFRISIVAHSDVETDRTQIIQRNFENVRIVETDDKTLLFDVRFDCPCLLIFIEKGDGR